MDLVKVPSSSSASLRMKPARPGREAVRWAHHAALVSWMLTKTICNGGLASPFDVL